MTEENKVSKEDTEEPLYFELKDNISSFYISDSDILKCILIADANHKIPTLDNNWIKQAEIYIQKNKKEDYSDKNIAKYQNEADDFYCPECGNCDFCFLFKDSEHEFLIPLEQIVFCLFICKEENVIVDTYPNFWMLMFNSYPSLQNLITENNYSWVKVRFNMNDIKDHKILVIVAGVNGAGKSTAYELDPRFANNIPIINPDVYAKEFANKVGAKSINDLPHNIQNTINIKAGKLALKARQEALKLGIEFGIETTATSEATLKLIDKAHSLNYQVNLLYVMLPDETFHIERVKLRAKTGGHFVSPDDIKRRFIRAQNLFPKLLKAADRVSVYDNTVGYKIALTKENGKYRIFPCEETIQKRLQKAVNEICRNEKQVAQNRANFINKKKSSDLER